MGAGVVGVAILHFYTGMYCTFDISRHGCYYLDTNTILGTRLAVLSRLGTQWYVIVRF